MDFTQAQFSHYLRLGPDVKGRLHVEDDRNVRYADLNKPQGTEVLLALVTQSTYRVVEEDGRMAVVPLSLSRRGAVRVGEFSLLTPTTARGELGEAMRKELFSIPFDQGFYRGFLASQRMGPASDNGLFNPPDAARQSFLPQRPRFLFGVPGMVLLGGGGLLGVGAGGLTAITVAALNVYARHLQQRGTVDAVQEGRINALRVAAAVTMALGISALALGGLLVAVELLWPVRHQETP